MTSHWFDQSRNHLTIGLITLDTVGRLTDDARAALLSFINRFTDPTNVLAIDLRPNSSTLTILGTDTSGHRYLVDGKLATVSWEISYGLEDIAG